MAYIYTQFQDTREWHDLISEWKDAPQALEHVLSYNDNIDNDIFLGKRTTREIFWVQLQPFLYSRGYNLRPRYHPDWLPSWRNHTKPIQTLDEFEDSLAHIGTFMDATRISDGSKVVIKIVQTRRKEIPIAQYLSSPEAMSDPRNHTIPVFDILPLPNDDSEALMIMPQVLHFDPPGLPFTRLGEFHEAVKQYIEGLEFMHQHRISHRDACYFNLMMDISKVIPKGLHFMRHETHDGVTFGVEWKKRWSVRPVEYYYIDFGLSEHYPLDAPYETITGLNGQDRTVPEHLLTSPYDPFKADVYQLGNVILHVVETYDGLDSFLPLGTAMTRTNPDDRPSPSEALKMLKRFNWWVLRRRVRQKEFSLQEQPRLRFLGGDR